MAHSENVQTTVSNELSAKPSACASPSRRSTSRPSSAARRRDREHGRAELDRGQPDTVGVVRQVQPGADGHLQHRAGGLRA
jgi:hypothetical protein